MDNKPTRQGEMVMRETENRMLDDGIESGGGGVHLQRRLLHWAANEKPQPGTDVGKGPPGLGNRWSKACWGQTAGLPHRATAVEGPVWLEHRGQRSGASCTLVPQRRRPAV